MLISTWAAPVDAYCRARTCRDRSTHECERDAKGCVSEGETLHQRSTCLTFAVADGSTDPVGLSATELETIVARAFMRWQEVDCGDGQTPGFAVLSAGIVQADAPHYCDVDDANVGLWILQSNWAYDERAFGNTAAVFDSETGAVFDADVELNLGKLERASTHGTIADRIFTVATHEAGHVLGLDHSDNPEALMAERYTDDELVTRAITPDDVRAICEVFPPDDFPAWCPTPGVPSGALTPLACADALNDTSATQRPLTNDSGCNVSKPRRSRLTTSVCFHPVAVLLSLWALSWRRRATTR